METATYIQNVYPKVTKLGERQFSPGDKITVKEPNGCGDTFVDVIVDRFTEADYLVVSDVYGNTWCIHKFVDVK